MNHMTPPRILGVVNGVNFGLVMTGTLSARILTEKIAAQYLLVVEMSGEKRGISLPAVLKLTVMMKKWMILMMSISL